MFSLLDRNKAQIFEATRPDYWARADRNVGKHLTRDEVILYFIEHDAKKFAEKFDKENVFRLERKHEK
jgi:hypothetical protein